MNCCPRFLCIHCAIVLTRKLISARYEELHQIIRESGGPYTPGVNKGAAQGGDGGERARRKAEEHAAAEAAKWGR